MRIALLCVLVAGLLPYLWTAVAKAVGPRYDNRHVREWQSRLTGRPLRAHYAHLNAFEAFPFFAASVLAALLAQADAQRVATLAIAFVVARVLHGIAYVADVAIARSLAWFVGFGCAVAILLTAIAALAW
jgi:uncharacterized MAPEG superfamily protein